MVLGFFGWVELYLRHKQAFVVILLVGLLVVVHGELSSSGIGDTQIMAQGIYPSKSYSKTVLVIVNKDYLNRSMDLFSRWFTASEYQGFDLKLYICEWVHDVVSLKNMLKNLYENQNLVGAIFVGSNDLYRVGEIYFEDANEHPYPMDLYLMDFDGIYRDTDNDGYVDKIDPPSGGDADDIAPEIFVARITSTYGLDIIDRMLNKSIGIMTGSIPILRNGTLFIDDDWRVFDYEIESWFSSLYSPLLVKSDPSETNRTTFFNLIHMASGLYYQAIHSAPTYLAINESKGYYSYVYNNEIAYNLRGGQISILFSCSAADYMVPEYLAETYLTGNNTIAVISSTKVGGLWYGNYLTEKLSQNYTLGESFRYWYQKVIENYYNGINTWYNFSWWLGMTIIGNPLYSLNVSKISPVDSDGDNIYDDVEEIYGTNALSNDTDGDGIMDSVEIIFDLDPLDSMDAEADYDNDGLENIQEIKQLTNLYDNDTDDDGIPDGWETVHGLNPFNPDDKTGDPDGDGLSNYEEYLHNTDPMKRDTDGDGMPDGWEINNQLDPLNKTDANGDPDHDDLSNIEEYMSGTNPNKSDTDNDGLTDGYEVHNNLNPLRKDTDNDCMPDGWEVEYGLDPLRDDASRDPDGDDLINYKEYLLGTDPQDNDTDGDGMPDGWEVGYGLDPLDSGDASADPDGDGLVNVDEYLNGTNPQNADTDGDSLNDTYEIQNGLNPLNNDTDGDGIPDGWEVEYGLDPLDMQDGYSDMDGDGLSNRDEYSHGTNPHLNDTDGDGFTDAEEVLSGTDPLDPSDHPRGIREIMILFFVGLLLIVLVVVIWARK